MSRTELRLDDGKYEFSAEDDGTDLRCSRYDEPWREFLGDNAVHSLHNYAVDQRQHVEELEKKLSSLRTAAEHAKQFIDQSHCPEEGNHHCEECTDLAVAIERSRAGRNLSL